MMTVLEALEMGYEVTVGSMFGDRVVTAAEVAEEEMTAEDFEDLELVEVDEEAHTAHFYEVDDGQYDE